jgi:hypothetical protein
MVAPIVGLFAGLGIAGARSLMQRREAEQQQQAFRDFGAQLFGLGGQQQQLAPGQFGPPAPAAPGSNLTEQQLNAMNALSVTNPELAVRFGLQFQQANQTQQTQQQNFLLQESQLDLQRDNFELSEDKHQLSLRRFLNEQNATHRDAADFAQRLQNPQFSMTRAIQEGDQVYALAAPDGSVRYAPVAGTSDFNESQQALRKSGDSLGRLNELTDQIRLFGQSGDPASLITRDIESLVSQIQLDIKDSEFNLGALSGPDQEFLERVLPDATSLREQLLSNPQAVVAGMARLSERMQQQNQMWLGRTQGWVGLDEGVQTRAIQQGQRAGQQSQLSGLERLNEQMALMQGHVRGRRSDPSVDGR